MISTTPPPTFPDQQSLVIKTQWADAAKKSVYIDRLITKLFDQHALLLSPEKYFSYINLTIRNSTPPPFAKKFLNEIIAKTVTIYSENLFPRSLKFTQPGKFLDRAYTPPKFKFVPLEKDPQSTFRHESLPAFAPDQQASLEGKEEADIFFQSLKSIGYFSWEADSLLAVYRMILAGDFAFASGIQLKNIQFFFLKPTIINPILGRDTSKWIFHAALGLVDLSGTLHVIDPALFNEAVPLENWINLITSNEKIAFLKISEITKREDIELSSEIPQMVFIPYGSTFIYNSQTTTLIVDKVKLEDVVEEDAVLSHQEIKSFFGSFTPANTPPFLSEF